MIDFSSAILMIIATLCVYFYKKREQARKHVFAWKFMLLQYKVDLGGVSLDRQAIEVEPGVYGSAFVKDGRLTETIDP